MIYIRWEVAIYYVKGIIAVHIIVCKERWKIWGQMCRKKDDKLQL
jgi:hypothetical protein